MRLVVCFSLAAIFVVATLFADGHVVVPGSTSIEANAIPTVH